MLLLLFRLGFLLYQTEKKNKKQKEQQMMRVTATKDKKKKKKKAWETERGMLSGVRINAMFQSCNL